MWKNWFLGIVGLWLIGLGFSGFPSETLKILVIISGVAVAFISFKSVSRHKVDESVKHLPLQDRPEEEEIKMSEEESNPEV